MNGENKSILRLRDQLYSHQPQCPYDWARLHRSEGENPRALEYIEHHSGRSSDELTELYGQWLMECTEKTGGFPSTGDRVLQCARLKRQGYTTREISALLGLSRTRVRECLTSSTRRSSR